MREEWKKKFFHTSGDSNSSKIIHRIKRKNKKIWRRKKCDLMTVENAEKIRGIYGWRKVRPKSSTFQANNTLIFFLFLIYRFWGKGQRIISLSPGIVFMWAWATACDGKYVFCRCVCSNPYLTGTPNVNASVPSTGHERQTDTIAPHDGSFALSFDELNYYCPRVWPDYFDQVFPLNRPVNHGETLLPRDGLDTGPKLHIFYRRIFPSFDSWTSIFLTWVELYTAQRLLRTFITDFDGE